MEAKIQTIVQESVARERLEWLKEKTHGHADDLAQVEKSLCKLALYKYQHETL